VHNEKGFFDTVIELEPLHGMFAGLFNIIKHFSVSGWNGFNSA